MDTRRSRSRDDRRISPAPGTNLDPVDPVELVELHTIGPSGWRHGPQAILAIAVVAILAFAGLAAAFKPPSAPLASAPAIGIASPSASAPSPSSTSARSTPKPSVALPTPRPTLPPAWAWHREDLLPGEGLLPVDVWAVDRQVLVLGFDAEGPRFARTEPFRAWVPLATPREFTEFMGGSVIDDQFFFVARGGGTTAQDASWELVSTATGDNFDPFGRAVGLGPLDGVGFVGRIGGTWVATPWQHAGEGGIVMDLRWSDDGVHWQPAEIPGMPGGGIFGRPAILRDTMVVLGTRDVLVPEGEGGFLPERFLLVSTDGRTWREAPFEFPSGQGPTDLACNDLACVLLVEQFEGECCETTEPLVLRTSDFEDWVGYNIVAPEAETGGLLLHLTVTDEGFLAMGNGTGYAFVSVDGTSWRSVAVMPSDLDESLIEVVVSGDTVFGIAIRPGNSPAGAWRGRVSAIPG